MTQNSNIRTDDVNQWFSTCGPWPTGGPWEHFEVGHRDI